MKKLLLLASLLNICLLARAIPLPQEISIYEKTQFALSAEPLLEEAAQFFTLDAKINAEYCNASPEITAFIHELLEQHGVPNAKDVAIKVGPNYETGNNTILLEWLNEGSAVTMLEYLIYEYNSAANTEEGEGFLFAVHQHIGSIEHEIAHIKNRDCKKRALYLASFSALTWAGLKAAEIYATRFFPALQKTIKDATWKSKSAYSARYRIAVTSHQ